MIKNIKVSKRAFAVLASSIVLTSTLGCNKQDLDKSPKDINRIEGMYAASQIEYITKSLNIEPIYEKKFVQDQMVDQQIGYRVIINKDFITDKSSNAYINSKAMYGNLELDSKRREILIQLQDACKSDAKPALLYDETTTAIIENDKVVGYDIVDTYELITDKKSMYYNANKYSKKGVYDYELIEDIKKK